MKLDFAKIDISNIQMIQGIAAGFLLIVLILDLSLFLPVIQNIQQAQIQRNKDAAAVSFFKGVISQKDQLTKARIIPAEDLEALLDKIQKIAEKDHIAIQIGTALLKDKKSKPQDFYVKKTFSVEAFGSLKDLGVFLTALRDSPDAVLDVESVELTSDKKDSSKLRAQIDLSVVTTKNEEDQ